MNRFLLLILILTVSLSAGAQPGKDGPMVVTGANTVVNCYSAVTNDVVAGTSQVTVNNGGGGNCNFVCGDLIMIYQAQGASINSSNTAAYGTITNYNNAGLYEFNYVVSANGNTLTVQSAWSNNYTASGRVQVIKVPQYSTLTVNANASIVPAPWQDVGNFRYGGIVAIHVNGTCTVNGSIHANGFGFRPGPLDNASSASGAGQITLYVGNNQADGGAKGESIAGFFDVYDVNGGRYGRGAPANGGGGGNSHNAGGGGGSNGNNGNAYNGNGVMCTACAGSAAWALDPFTVTNGGVPANSSGGGRGGYSYGANNQNALTLAPAQANWGGDQRDPFGGYGGKPLTTTPATRIFMGGGGGAGDRNNNANLLGGTGGGIVYLFANSVTGGGQINSNGTDALNQVSSGTAGANDAPSGGGGGGTVIVRSAAVSGVAINARGGKGGDQGFLNSESEGPGGGGGGGYVAIAAGTPTINTNGGDNGITLSGSLTEFTPNGATMGATGQTGSISTMSFSFNPFGPITTSSNSPLCSGANLNLTTTAIAGATYSWSGPNGFTSTVQNPVIPAATVAASGQYQVIYTLGGACNDTGFVTVNVYPLPVITMPSTNPLCNGACTGVITASVTSGQAPYTYNWSNGASTQAVNNLCAGTYNVIVTDAHACTATANATITQPTAVTATITSVSPQCNGACNGSVTITASGGTGALQYSINGGAFQASNVFNGLCAGAYTVTVRDGNNCTQTLNTTLTQPTVVTLTQSSITTATCGMSNGSVTVAAAGGTAPYQYSIDGGALQTSATFNGLSAGGHTVTVTDSQNCIAILQIVISNSAGPSASIGNQTNLSCFGGANGSVLITAGGGTAPLTYDLNPGPGPQASNMFNNLTAGTYTVVVADANGCTSNVNFTITSPTQLTYTTTPTPATCNGTCNGQILFNASGGTAPYVYSVNNGLTFTSSNPQTGLCAGNINAVVRDANGCLANSVVIIQQPAAITATYAQVNPICDGACNGQITVNATGGTSPYQYSVNGGTAQSSNILSNLCAGNHTVTIQDANGCSINSIRTLTNPPGYTVNIISNTSSNCGFNDGAFEVAATGGVPPYQYSSNGSANQSSGIFANIVGGAYTVIVTDALGCQEQIFVGVNDIQMSASLVSITNVSCFGGNDGSATAVNTGGGAPISYELDNSSISQPSGTFMGLMAGPHLITVYDAGLCVANVPFTITQPNQITFTTNTVNINCFNGATGQITFTGTAGGTGAYQYSVTGAGGTFQSSPTFTGLTAGTYNLAVLDANNCLETGTVTLTQNTAVAFVTNVTNLSCFNNSSGSLQLVASGGQTPYQYSINNGVSFSSNLAFSGLAAGNYNAVVQDALGCQATNMVTINQPAALAAGYVVNAASCNSVCNGNIQVNANGGTAPYLYSADAGTTFQTSPLLSGLCAGSYQVVVTDANNCLVGSTHTITQPTPVTYTVVTQPATCNTNNGSITITANGGTPAYTYSVNSGSTFQPANQFTGLAPGPYQILVHDANNCPQNSTVTIADEAPPVITGVAVNNVTCTGACNGSLNVNAIGGTGALQYNIGGAPQASATFNGLCAMTCTVTVTDANGCADTHPATITEPAALTFTTNTTPLQCYNNFTGGISINANGGVTPYQYSYDNGSTFTTLSSASSLSAGVYNLVVKDANTCQANGQATVNQPAQLTIASQNSISPTCFAGCNGQASVNVTGGTVSGLYTYLWSSGVAGTNQNTAINLCAGSYGLVVEDDNGCIVNTSFTLVNPPQFVVTSANVTDVLCTGDCNGTININASGGTQYSINGGTTYANNPSFANLCPGVYQLQVVNAANCVANSVAVVNEPSPVTVISTPDSTYCSGSVLPLSAYAYGGNPPYTYQWSNGVNQAAQNVTPNGTQTFMVYATDNNGCVSNTDSTVYTPFSPYTATLAATSTITCPGAPVTLAANMSSGYPFYQYNWSNGDTTQSITITNNVAGTYSVIVNDQCFVYDTLSIAINTYALPQVNFSMDVNEGCTPLAVTFTNNTPPNQVGTDCIWTFSDGSTMSGCGSVSATFTAANCYNVTLAVTSPDGCVGTLTQNAAFCVHPIPVANFYWSPEEPTFLAPGVQFTNFSQLGDTYLWNFAGLGTSTSENPAFSFAGQDTGAYQICLEVTSEHGCVDDTCRIIHMGEETLVYVPNAFTPNQDGTNDLFFPVFTNVIGDEYEFMVFDRWGEMIYITNNITGAWDGTFKNQRCKEDVYVWKLKLKDERGSKFQYYGHVSLLR